MIEKCEKYLEKTVQSIINYNDDIITSGLL